MSIRLVAFILFLAAAIWKGVGKDWGSCCGWAGLAALNLPG